MIYLFLAFSILFEVIATTALKASEGFTRLAPSLVTIFCYSAAFYCLTIPMKTMPTGVIYAIWSGSGIVLISIVSWIIYGQRLDMPAIVGIALILSGVIIINVLSRSFTH